MNVVFEMIVFNGMPILEASLESILPFGRVVAVEGPVSWYREKGYTTSTDGTNEVLDRLLPDRHIHGQFAEKEEMVNLGLSMVPDDTDFVFAVDADEVWKPEELQRVIAILEKGETDSMAFRFISFYGGFERTMTGFEYNFENHRVKRYYPGCVWASHRPPEINAPDGKPWREHRHLSHVDTSALGMFIYHYSYVFASQMAAKADYYRQQNPRGHITDYMNKVYLPWVKGNARTRLLIERRFKGVHDWIPARRGGCHTIPFTGEHPDSIKKRLPELEAYFAQDLAREQ